MVSVMSGNPKAYDISREKLTLQRSQNNILLFFAVSKASQATDPCMQFIFNFVLMYSA